MIRKFACDMFKSLFSATKDISSHLSHTVTPPPPPPSSQNLPNHLNDMSLSSVSSDPQILPIPPTLSSPPHHRLKGSASWKWPPFFIVDLPKTLLFHLQLCMSFAWKVSHFGEISQKHGAQWAHRSISALSINYWNSSCKIVKMTF